MAAGDVTSNITRLRSMKGALFDGVDDYVEIPHNDSQIGNNLSNGFTISAWINPKSVGQATVGRIIDKSTGGAGNNGFLVRTRGTTKIAFIINNGTLASTEDGSITFRVWQHVLITVSKQQLVNFYINGVLSGTANQDVVQTISTITTTNAPRIGNRSTTDDRTFDGLIKGVKMWNRVLSADEIAKAYIGTPIPDGLILDVPLQEDYNDKSQFALTGTNSGTSFKEYDDQLPAVLEAAGAKPTDRYLLSEVNGQILSAVVEEA